METEPLERIDEHQSGETPEDVAILYSWANLQGAKYRDFSANRREYRAQMRHRAAEQLRLMELRAQSEAEAAAAQAEAGAAAAHADADAATVKLAVSRSMPSAAPEAILEEKEVEQIRKASLREAAQQARRAAAERLEAARRAEAAALADSIARREEREIAEAQASALRQAAQYHDSEAKSRQMMAQQPEGQVPVPGQLNDPYSPQILAEGEYYDGPGTPPSELQASRFRLQREYIEKATGTELPPFKMPPLFNEDRPTPRPQHPERLPVERVATDRSSEYGRAPQPRSNVRDLNAHGFAPRRISETSPEDRDYYPENRDNYPENRDNYPEDRGNYMERHLREERNASPLYRREPAAPEPRVARAEAAHERFKVPSTPYNESQRHNGEPARPARAEVVSRIPEDRRQTEWERNEHIPGYAEPRLPLQDDRHPGAPYDGSLISPVAARPVRSAGDYAPVTDTERPQSQPEWSPEAVEPWLPRRNAPPARASEVRQAGAQFGNSLGAEQQHAGDRRPDLFEDVRTYPATPRPSGSWLKRISGDPQIAPLPLSVPAKSHGGHPASRSEPQSGRPSVEATYSDGLTSDSLIQPASHPSGFRPPWLTQAQAPRPSGSRNVAPSPAAPEKQTPQWLYPEPPVPEADLPPVTPPSPVTQQQKTSAPEEAGIGYQDEGSGTLQASQEAVASRWFALKGVFAQPEPPERQAPREKSRIASTPVPTIAVFSLAGGVGKTSLVAILGRALSSLGEKVLLADTTLHGLLPFYFGAKELHPGVVRTFAPPNGSTDAPVHMVSYSLDAAGANIEARRKTIEDLLAAGKQANRVLIDLSPNSAWIVEKLAGLKPTVLVPLAADMNSIISLQAVEKSFSAMRDGEGEPLRPVYLLNQFDASLPLHLDVREVLRQRLGDRLLPFVVRRGAGVSEALAEGMTIIDYDPDSATAQDCLGLANWIRAASAPATAGFRNLRWSER